MTKRLIVNADDLGRSAGVNRGIFEAHTKGIVTSATVMINFPDAPDAIAQALNHAPGLGLGLHLNLTSGRPLSQPGQVASLVGDEGQFYHISRWPDLFDQFQAGDFERELRAQIERFTELAGHAPSHIDAHHHAPYLHPDAFPVLLDIAHELAIPIRKPVAAGDLTQATQYIDRVLKGLAKSSTDLVAQLKALLPGETTDAQPLWPDFVHRGFYGDTATLGDLLVILTTLPQNATVELICHPGYTEGLNSSYAEPREHELTALTHPAAAEVIESESIDLIMFKDL